jgi:chromosome segregation ATPase
MNEAKRIEELEERLTRAEAELKEIRDERKAINTAVLHPDKGHGGPRRYAA